MRLLLSHTCVATVTGTRVHWSYTCVVLLVQACGSTRTRVGTTRECEVALILYRILTLKYLLTTCSSLEPIEDTMILSAVTRNIEIQRCWRFILNKGSGYIIIMETERRQSESCVVQEGRYYALLHLLLLPEAETRTSLLLLLYSHNVVRYQCWQNYYAKYYATILR